MNDIRKLCRIHIQSSRMENNNKLVGTRFKHYKSKPQTIKIDQKEQKTQIHKNREQSCNYIQNQERHPSNRSLFKAIKIVIFVKSS